MGSRDDELKNLVIQARAASANDDWPAAAAAYEQVLQIAPDHPSSEQWWFNAALAYKFLRNWQKAFELGKQAAARSRPGEGDPAFWNLGIAATILREWAVARYAWRDYGIEIEPGEGPIEQGFGTACVRITTPSGEEVVWAERLCPARARVINVPFDTSRRFGEVVVHDGTPNGERVSGERQVPVFDELVLFEPSSLVTLSTEIQSASAEDTSALLDAFYDGGYGAEVRTGRVICRACDEGSVVQSRHEHETGPTTLLIAAPEPQAVEILGQWRAGGPDARHWTDLAVA